MFEMYSGYIASYYNEIISTVVICNPSCVNGACIANDTCQCGMGYTGQICTEAGEPANSYTCMATY